MITIKEHVPLHTYTTFNVGGPARFFVEVKRVDDLREAVEWAEAKGIQENKAVPIFVLGGGSNILVSDKGFDGLVILMSIKGLEVDALTLPEKVLVRVGAGENWDEFVSSMVDRGFGGLENLSYIPGTVGAAPVQNIGAYGVEVATAIHSVEVFSCKDKTVKTFTPAECAFSYRDSFFKHHPGEYIITYVSFSLTKNGRVNISYKDVTQFFTEKAKKGGGKAPEVLPTIREVRDAVISIRSAKLPDWKVIGTAGSFFKNPIICMEHFDGLKKEYPELPGFPAGEGVVKVPLAWILDNVCGFKGSTRFDGAVGVYKNQALVIVNNAKRGEGSATQVKALADEMIKAVKEKTGIDIEPEVQYVGE